LADKFQFTLEEGRLKHIPAECIDIEETLKMNVWKYGEAFLSTPLAGIFIRKDREAAYLALASILGEKRARLIIEKACASRASSLRHTDPARSNIPLNNDEIAAVEGILRQFEPVLSALLPRIFILFMRRKNGLPKTTLNL